MKRYLFVGAACAALAVTGAAPALAEDVPPPGTATVSQVRPVVVANAATGTASVQFHYSCTGTVDTDHLFVAVKQGPDVNTTDHSGSSYANTFYSTNWNVDQGPNALVCDGRKHLMQAVLQPDPYFAKPDPAPLSAGTAFVQICLFDSTGLTMDYHMRKVAVS